MVADHLYEYVKYHDLSKERHGSNCVVFMEVGKFFELYALKNEHMDIGADIYHVCGILEIQVTRRNKQIEQVSEHNYLQAGFPSSSVRKFIDILLAHNYTIVLVEQMEQGPNPSRQITTTFSPSMNIDEMKSYDTNLMMVIYFEKAFHWKKKMSYMNVGCSTFDASTGKSSVIELMNELDEKVLFEEVYRLLLVHNPREVVFLSKNEEFDESHFIQAFDLDTVYFHNRMNQDKFMFDKIQYQQSVLDRVFQNRGFISSIEYIDMEYKPTALVSYVYLIQFVFEHNENLLSKIQKPIVHEATTNTLILANNSVHQLNIVSGDASIHQLFNLCQTSMGKRYFKKMLLNPITNCDELRARYKRTRVCIEKECWTLSKKMQTIVDVERMIRKMTIGRLQPCEFASLHTSLVTLDDVLREISDFGNDMTACFPDLKVYIRQNAFPDFLTYCSNTILLHEISKYNLDKIKGNLFVNGVFPELDVAFGKCQEILQFFNSITQHVSDQWLKLENNDRDGYHFTMTTKRWETLKRNSHPITNQLSKLHTSTSHIKLSSDTIKQKNKQLQDLENSAREQSIQAFVSFMGECVTHYGAMFSQQIHVLEVLDFHITCAKNAVKKGLSEPIIRDEVQKSFVHVTNVRHPIIEKMQQHVQYTPNTLEIGALDTNVNGMILFGVNSSGKSSLMKSIGVCIIMAQAGMYVPCDEMVYSPYHELFTRIQSVDNIAKGKSTFTNELSELRNIFKRSTDRSIVIGDELCSGTESISALSIVTAGIEKLVKMNSSFIFTTHLHELNNLERIKDLKINRRITIQHMSVYYDEATKELVYDRVLKDGPGSSLYGLEVCKAMDLEPDFVHMASLIRQEILNNNDSNFVVQKLSKYNAQLVVDDCKVCGSKTQVETHHIVFQKDADTNGMIQRNGPFHKNAQFNLVPLCEECHEKVHHDVIRVNGWVQTTNGVKLDFSHVEKNKGEQENEHRLHTLVHTVRAKNSLTQTLHILNVEHKMNISKYKINKIMRMHLK